MKRIILCGGSGYIGTKLTEVLIAETEYDQNFCSAVQKGNIIGVQFHPEKSQKTGQILIKNFLNLQ